MLADLALVSLVWLGAYGLRFHTGLDALQGTPSLAEYALALAGILPIYGFMLQRQGVYQPKRLGSFWTEAAEIGWATTGAVVLLLALSFFLRSYSFSRIVAGIFAVSVPMVLMAFRFGVRGSLRIARRKGYNQRFALVVGSGRLADEIIGRIHDHPSSGLRVVGILADRAAESAGHGIPVLGGYADLRHAISQQRIDHVILALRSTEADRLEKVLADLDDEVVSVMLAPDLLHIATLRSSVENFDGLPIIHLRDSPLVGWASVQKRAFDILGSSASLVLGLPALVLLAAGILVSSGSPVLYRQKRMGLDGGMFTMLKLRTMRRDAEGSGPGCAPRAAGIHPGVPARDPQLHASPQGEVGDDGLGPGARLAGRHLSPIPNRARHLLHPELVHRSGHQDPRDDDLERTARPKPVLSSPRGGADISAAAGLSQGRAAKFFRFRSVHPSPPRVHRGSAGC